MSVEVKDAVVANLASRMMHFKKAGDVEVTHTHSFDHLTLLASGSVKCTVDGNETEFHAPHMIYIKKEHMHSFEALEDNTVAFCIHAMRIGERVEDIADPSMFPSGVKIPPEIYSWWSPEENHNGENKEAAENPSTNPTGKIAVTSFG